MWKQLTDALPRVRLVASEDNRASPASRADSPKSPTEGGDKVVIDPSKGGAVSPKAEKQSKALEVQQGHWIWDGLAKILEIDIFSPAWEVRHGAAMALRELLKHQGKFGGTQGVQFLLLSAYMLIALVQSGCRGKRTRSRMRSGATTLRSSFSASSYWIASATSFQTRCVSSCAIAHSVLTACVGGCACARDRISDTGVVAPTYAAPFSPARTCVPAGDDTSGLPHSG